MECISTCRVLDFRSGQLESVRKQYNLDKPGDMSRAIDVLEAWVKVQKHFEKKDLPRNYLEKTIITSKGSLERAKNKLDKICTFRTVMPNYFGDNLTKYSFQNLHVFQNVLLPKPTTDNYRVYILKVVGSIFTFDAFMDCYKFMIMLCEYIMAYDYNDGVIIFLDYTDANLLEIIKSLTMPELQQFFTIVTEGFGMRLKEINILTTSKAVHTLVAIFKQIISPKLGKRISIHRDISTLYQNIPKDILPIDYGGNEKSFEELYGNIKEELKSKDFIKYLEDMNDAKTDESCRQIDTFNQQYLGIPGSFRTLNVD